MIYKQLPERRAFYEPTGVLLSHFTQQLWLHLFSEIGCSQFFPQALLVRPGKERVGGDVLIEFANFAFAGGRCC
jgi:hypothetical protein